MTTVAKHLLEELMRIGDPEKARKLQRFFKTGAGEYGEGDLFLGSSVPQLRSLSRRTKQATLEDAIDLLHSVYHEARLLALFLLVRIYEKGDPATKQSVYEAYLAHVQYINNWDLVDSSAMQIVGHFLMDKDRSHLKTLARSSDLWERRIAIIATFYFIKQYEFEDTLEVALILLQDKQDLIHKAVGWMLREVGNRSRPSEESFLKQHYQDMPRTMLRYAIEKFPEDLRQAYLKGTIQP